MVEASVRVSSPTAAQATAAASANKQKRAVNVQSVEVSGLASTKVVEFQNSPQCRFCGGVEVAIGPEG